MSNSSKRPRGRPKGSGKNDTPDLVKVADLIAHDPTLRPTTAIKRVLASKKLQPGEMEQTVLRRLQHKWTIEGPLLLAQAQYRRAATPSSTGSLGGWFPSAYYGSLDDPLRMARMQQELERLADPLGPVVERARLMTELSLGIHQQGNFMDHLAGIDDIVGKAAAIQRALEGVDFVDITTKAQRALEQLDTEDLAKKAQRALEQLDPFNRRRW